MSAPTREFRPNISFRSLVFQALCGRDRPPGGPTHVCTENGALGDGIESQTKNAIENLSAVLLAAGSSLDRVVKTTCFLANISDFASFNEIYGKYFTGRPARSLIEAAALPKGAVVEIEAIAEIR